MTLNPPQAIRLKSKGEFDASHISLIRGSAITCRFPLRFGSFLRLAIRLCARCLFV